MSNPLDLIDHLNSLPRDYITISGYRCYIEYKRYSNTNIAMRALSAEENPSTDLYIGEPITILTVNISAALMPAEVVIKSYGENEGMLDIIKETGLLRDTKVTVSTQTNLSIPVHVLIPAEQFLQTVNVPTDVAH